MTLVSPAHLAPFALSAGRLTGVRVIPWEPTFLKMDLPDMHISMRILPALRRFTYQWAPAVAAVSHDVALDVMRAVPKSPVVELPNPVASDEIRAAASVENQTVSKARGRFRLVASSRLTYQKGIDVLLRAVELATSSGERVELIVLGDGPLRASLNEQAERDGLRGIVKFIGHTPNPYPVMASADLFVHAARWEGFGLVLAEALALGVPVLATSCPGGPKEILGAGRFGMLVPPDSPEALAAGITRLTQDSTLRERLRRAGPGRADQYRPELVTARLLDIVSAVEERRVSKIAVVAS
jgi:glycosyltransferase involved in cell wall biosynthesis